MNNYFLRYGDKHKKISAEMNDTTTNRCIISGVIDSFLIKKPTAIDIITSTAIEVKRGV